MTSTQVSRAAKLVDEELEIWRNRPRDQIESLIVDARYEKVRVAGSVRDSLMMESPEAPMALHQPRGVKKVERALCPMNSEVAWVDVIRFSVEFERRQNGTGKK